MRQWRKIFYAVGSLGTALSYQAFVTHIQILRREAFWAIGLIAGAALRDWRELHLRRCETTLAVAEVMRSVDCVALPWGCRRRDARKVISDESHRVLGNNEQGSSLIGKRVKPSGLVVANGIIWRGKTIRHVHA